MGISLLGASTGLSASDLITTPSWTLLGSFESSVGVTTTTFSNISSVYRTLKIYVNEIQWSTAGQLQVRPNSDSNANYIYYGTENSGNGLGFALITNATSLTVNRASTGYSASGVITIYNSNSSTEYKPIEMELTYGTNGAGTFNQKLNGLWYNTSAITSMNFSSTQSFAKNSAHNGRGIFLYGAK